MFVRRVPPGTEGLQLMGWETHQSVWLYAELTSADVKLIAEYPPQPAQGTFAHLALSPSRS